MPLYRFTSLRPIIPAFGAIISVIIVYTIWTFPLCLEPQHFLVGHPGDSIMTLERWETWRLDVKYIERPLLNIAGVYLTDILDPIITYNLFVAISFPLTALTAYALFYWVTGHALASILGAVFFALSPYHWAHSLGHLYLAHIQWIPLSVLSLGLFITAPSLRNTIILILSMGLLIGTSYYYAFFLFLILASLTPFAAIASISRGYGKKIALIIGIAAILILISLPLTKSYLSWLIHKPVPRIMLVEDIMRYTARPREYIMPGGISAIRRIWSPIVTPGSLHASNEVEQAIFIGWFPLFLSCIALITVLRNPRIVARISALKWICGGAIIAAVLSAPPAISLGSANLWTPNYFISRIVPFFRSFVRMSVFVHLAVYLLAAVGLSRIIRYNAKWAILAGILGILEFTPVPPPRILRLLPERPIYTWISDISSIHDIIEFPFMSRRTPRANRRMYFNTIHGRYSVSDIGTVDVRHCSNIRENTCRELQRAGVGTIIFHHDPPEPQLQVYKDRIARDPSVLRPWPRVLDQFCLDLRSHHPGSITYSILSPPSPIEFGIRMGAGRWEEGRSLIGRQLAAVSEFGVRSHLFRPIHADINLTLGHSTDRPYEWVVHLNDVELYSTPVRNRVITIHLEDIELLPDLNTLRLTALDKEGHVYSHDVSTPVGFLREVNIDP